MVKLNVPRRPPKMFRLVRTETISPDSNLSVGTKLPPCPSESLRTVPLRAPVREPVTEIIPRRSAAIPRNVICVSGDAVLLPGVGNTLIATDTAPDPRARAIAATRLARNTINPDAT